MYGKYIIARTLVNLNDRLSNLETHYKSKSRVSLNLLKI